MATMGTSARAAGGDHWSCEKCGASYVVEGPRERARKRLRCIECGYGEDAWLVPAQNGRYTLVDPTGAVTSAETLQELTTLAATSSASAMAPAGSHDDAAASPLEQKPPSKFPSAAALLDLTPAISLTRVEPKLTLVVGGGEASSGARDVEPPLAEPVAPPPSSSREELDLADVKLEDGPVSDEPEPISLRDVAIESEKEENARTSEEVEAVSLRELEITKDSRTVATADEAEPLSLRDVIVEPSSPGPMPTETESKAEAEPEPKPEERPSQPAPLPAPPPPGKGKLKPLPVSRQDAPPPPTIDVDEPLPQSKRAKGRSRAAVVDRRADSVPPSPQASTSKNRWPIFVAAAFGLGFVGYVLSNSSSSTSTSPSTSTTATEQPTTAAPPDFGLPTATVAAPVVTHDPAATVATSAPAVTTTAATTTVPPTTTTAHASGATTSTATGVPGSAAGGAATGKTPNLDANLSLSELLEKASAARRSGEADRAKQLYERALSQHAGDVEAHAGLADLARAQGDLPTAKKHYAAALASSPSFYPALLGLADTQWDLGETDEARSRYQKILSMPAAAPPRVRERAGAAAPKPAPSAPAAPEE